jgi:CBS domain-containing protein
MTTTARDLVSSRFVRIGEAHSTAEAIGIMFDPQATALREIVIIVLDAEGGYLGMVEPRDVLESLGTELSAAGDDPAAQVAAIRRGLKSQVSEIARRGVPAVQLGDSLASLLALAAQTESASIPVFDGKDFVGVIPVTAVFDALCTLTLSSAGEGLPFIEA